MRGLTRQVECGRRSRLAVTGRALLVNGGLAFTACMMSSSAFATVVNIANGYHYQQTSFFCGEGAMEMQFDAPAVTSTNALVANAMANVRAANAGGFAVVPENGAPTVVLPGDFTIQNQLYGTIPSILSSTVWDGFANFAFATHTGTPPLAMARVMNAVDAPPNGIHNYGAYGFSASAVGANSASRTLALALKLYDVPASAVVMHGAHWIDVNGVRTTGAIGLNAPYKINGFFVKDPWTGFAITNPAQSGGAYGLGFNTYLRYGRPWFSFFNPAPNAGNRYALELEPQSVGPVPIDDGTNDSLPPDPPPLAQPLDASTALLQAISDLASDPTLSTEPGLTNGAFDPTLADLLQVTIGGDAQWLVPFDGNGGTDDVTGALLVDTLTGVIDQATWIDPLQDPVDSITLLQLQTMFLDEQNGILPQDDPLAGDLPEPASVALLVPALVTSLAFRRRRRAAKANAASRNYGGRPSSLSRNG